MKLYALILAVLPIVCTAESFPVDRSSVTVNGIRCESSEARAYVSIDTSAQGGSSNAWDADQRAPKQMYIGLSVNIPIGGSKAVDCSHMGDLATENLRLQNEQLKIQLDEMRSRVNYQKTTEIYVK